MPPLELPAAPPVALPDEPPIDEEPPLLLPLPVLPLAPVSPPAPELLLPVVSDALPELLAPPLLPAPAAPAYAEYSVLLNLPSLSASSDLNCCDKPLSFFASDLVILLSPFLSSCEKLMLALPLLDAPAPISLELPLAPAPVLLEGEDELLSDGDEAEPLLEDGADDDELPDAPAPAALASPLALLPILPLLSLEPDSAKAPNEAREADIARVKISFLFMRISCTVEH